MIQKTLNTKMRKTVMKPQKNKTLNNIPPKFNKKNHHKNVENFLHLENPYFTGLV